MYFLMVHFQLFIIIIIIMDRKGFCFNQLLAYAYLIQNIIELNILWLWGDESLGLDLPHRRACL